MNNSLTESVIRLRLPRPSRNGRVRDRSALTVPRRDWQALLAVLFALDGILLGVAVGAAGLLRLRLDGLSPLQLTPGLHTLASLLVFPVLLGLFWVNGLYERDSILAGTREYAQITHATTYGVLLALAASYFAGNPQFVSRAWLILVWVFCIASVSLGRFAVRRVVRHLRKHGLFRTRIAIVGASSFGVAIAEQLRAATDEGLDVVGFLDEYIPLGQPLLDGLKVIGRPGDLLRNPPCRLADEYILIPQALPYERQEEIARLMAAQADPVLRMAVSSSDLLTHGVRVSERGNVPLVTVERARLRGLELIWKRAFDLLGGTLALVLLAPVVALMLLRHLGRRKLFQRHTISSATGHAKIWLFDQNLATGPLLRGAPALVGVLLGHFSLVGPRPVVIDSEPAGSLPFGLTAIKPGLTGAWRLSGPDASLAEQAIQDLSYVRNYTIWEDIRIVWESLRRLRHGHLPALLGRWDTSGGRSDRLSSVRDHRVA
jgi:lipopolysaccharide/colanic/teichoic acid biosynthesis glycosyltransferase